MNTFDRQLFWDNDIYLPYSEELDEEGYVYNVLINCDGKEGLIFICESGVHVEWQGKKGFIDTNLCPKRIFGKFNRLDDSQLKQIITTLININFEGFYVNEKKLNKLIKKYEEKSE